VCFNSAETGTAYFPNRSLGSAGLLFFHVHIVEVHVKTNSLRDLKFPHSVALSRIQYSAM